MPGRPRWCVVRNPIFTRWQSDVAWGGGNGKWFGAASVSPTDLLTIFGRSRREALPWTEELLHKQPQHFFVWAADGRVQCDCVVAFEKLHLFAGEKRWNGRPHRSADPQFSQEGLHPALELLYSLDVQLWASARQTDELCYRPMPLPRTVPRREELDLEQEAGRRARPVLGTGRARRARGAWRAWPPLRSW